MNIPRLIESGVKDKLLHDKRVIVLYGPRQVGKTTLAKKIVFDSGKKTLELSGDNPRVQEVWASQDLRRIEDLVSGYEIVFLDEAQKIPDIGASLKLLHDSTFSGNLLITGSSSLDLAGRTKEALTGRTWTFTLYPIAFAERTIFETPYEIDGHREETLVLGSYPALASMPLRQDRIAHLVELCSAYLYKDILDLAGIRNPRKLRDLLRLLAYQAGSEVSYQELGRQTGMSADTVISWIDLLEKTFVVFRMGGYSRNLRKEISKKDKVYFFDNGVRNALIEDFKEWPLRGDQGALWENFLVSERKKANAYKGFYGGSWFWRTHSGAELDYVEECDGKLSGFEFKLRQKDIKAPSGWTSAYPDASFQTIHPGNYLDFVVRK
ncbi:MAG: ATP-binding protein [Rectinemataceae bacterium]|nr:ATP-binding protein [Rectinemataceae bacterium]